MGGGEARMGPEAAQPAAPANPLTAPSPPLPPAARSLAFGSVHGAAALELAYWLRRVEYQGSIYFDTFPGNEDPVREAELNIRRFKALWARAGGLEAAGLGQHLARHDAMGALELLAAAETGGGSGGGGGGGGGGGAQCDVPDVEED
jgi:hypothetical protein